MDDGESVVIILDNRAGGATRTITLDAAYVGSGVTIGSGDYVNYTFVKVGSDFIRTAVAP
jgi:hypothetical protein